MHYLYGRVMTMIIQKKKKRVRKIKVNNMI